MRIESPCDWIIERLRAGRPFFTVRINDGEMCQMYRTKPEGSLLGTSENPAYTHHALGDAYLRMLEEMSNVMMDSVKGNILIGCSWNTERADELGRGPFADDVRRLELKDANWCNEHWPLDAVVDGSIFRLLGSLRHDGAAVVLVTCEKLMGAIHCFDKTSSVLLIPTSDSWTFAENCFEFSEGHAQAGCLFVWCAGCGLKPTAWNLFRKYPQSSHLDLGHLFNGAFGFKDYGWLERGDGPWYESYFTDFVPYVKRCLEGDT